jgi:hypothetical protein
MCILIKNKINAIEIMKDIRFFVTMINKRTLFILSFVATVLSSCSINKNINKPYKLAVSSITANIKKLVKPTEKCITKRTKIRSTNNDELGIKKQGPEQIEASI